MRMIGMGALLAIGVMTTAACSQEANESDDENAIAITDDLAPEAKAKPSPGGSTAGPTMRCTQATGGCVPVGYRAASCTLSNFKPNSVVEVCVKAVCPAYYGFSSRSGESCFAPQRVAADGAAFAFFALAPDATYSFTTYSGAKLTTVAATASSTLLSSIGETTQCGGTPSGSCY